VSGLTKIFIVLATVFSLALSVLLMLFISKQDSYKSQLDAANSARLAALATAGHSNAQFAALQQQLTAAQDQARTAEQNFQKAKNDAITEIAALTSRIQTLEKTNQLQVSQLANASDASKTQASLIAQYSKEIAELPPKVQELIQRNAELARRNNDLENGNRAAEQAIRKLQEELASATAKGGGSASAASITSGMGGQVTPLNEMRAMSGPINGQITDLQQHAGRTYIQTPLGSRDGLKTGSVLAVYRGNTYLGDARVENVTTSESVSVITTVKPGETIQKGDLVMTGQ